MSIDITINEQVHIPAWVNDAESFRRWTLSPDYPEQGWFAYLGDRLWMDLSMERQVHNRIKSKANAVLTLLAERARSGLYYADRMQLWNTAVGLVTEPDGMYVSYAAVECGRVQLLDGDESMQVLGSPDMVLEIISPNSVSKDTELLPRLYWEARIPEYWLIDSRADEPVLDILRRRRHKYVAAPKEGGWVKSAVFGKEFRLTRHATRVGVSDFTLDVR